MNNLKGSGGDWRIRKTVDESGDYSFPTYDIIAMHEYGPEGIGTSYQNPYNARLFACSKQLLIALIDLYKHYLSLSCGYCDESSESCHEDCIMNKTKKIIELASRMTIEEILGKDIIEDGHGNTRSKKCPVCEKESMEVVRPGKVQCSNCE